MSVIARRIAATPKRTATEVWQLISELIADQSSSAWKDLVSVTGIAAAMIADDIPQSTPFVVVGEGPRVRIYCKYGEDALLGDDCNEDPLAQKPTSENWHVYIPCTAEDLPWVEASLSSISTSIVAYDKDKEPDIEKRVVGSRKLTVNIDTVLKRS